MRLGGIEAGGTKFVVGIGNENGEILLRSEFETTDPKSTIEKCVDFFTKNPIDALGIASFGPIELDRLKINYGYITSTPKKGWENTPIYPYLKESLKVPTGFDTDVNAAALGEYIWGNGSDVDSLIYLTIGTGIGGGIISSGKLIHGLMHPEMGHIQLSLQDKKDFVGVCPYHKACFEGLASGPAMEARWGKKAKDLPFDHPAWKIEDDLIAQALVNYILIISPHRIILGGGVMHQTQLFPMIRQSVREQLNGYLQTNIILNDSERFIMEPKLKDDAGLCGAFSLALNALKKLD
jgi:fructokinase